MRTSALTCATVLLATAVGVSSYQQRPAAAQAGTLPCTDPRGTCPNLVVTEPILNSAHESTQTFAPTDCTVLEGETKAGTRDLLIFPYKTPNLGPAR